MQKKQILKTQQELIHHSLLGKTDLVNLKSDVDKLDIIILQNVPNNLNNLKSNIDKLDIRKLETTLVYLSELNNVVKK